MKKTFALLFLVPVLSYSQKISQSTLSNLNYENQDNSNLNKNLALIGMTSLVAAFSINEFVLRDNRSRSAVFAGCVAINITFTISSKKNNNKKKLSYTCFHDKKKLPLSYFGNRKL